MSFTNPIFSCTNPNYFLFILNRNSLNTEKSLDLIEATVCGKNILWAEAVNFFCVVSKYLLACESVERVTLFEVIYGLRQNFGPVKILGSRSSLNIIIYKDKEETERLWIEEKIVR